MRGLFYCLFHGVHRGHGWIRSKMYVTKSVIRSKIVSLVRDRVLTR